jgi:hypothetical protein
MKKQHVVVAALLVICLLPGFWIGKATSASNGGTVPVDYTARDIVVAYHE